MENDAAENLENPAAPSPVPEPSSPRDGAPGPKTTDGLPVRNKGGRPPGRRDSKPRKRREQATAAGTVRPPPTPAGDPFAAPTVGEAGPTAPGAVQGPAAAPKVNVAAMMPAEALAGAVLGTGSELLATVGEWRYPEEWCAHLKLTDQEKAVLEPLLVEYLKTGGVTMSPGEALALFAFLIIGAKVAVLEKELRRVKRAGPAAAPAVELKAAAA